MPRKTSVPPEEACGCLTRKKTPCGNKKGYKTDHVGTGPCHLHGGGKGTGAPKGNKNALKTGEYETIHLSALTPEEQDLYGRIETIDPRTEVENEIRLISIREHRISLRITKARQAEDESDDGLAIASETVSDGWNQTGQVDMTVTEYGSLSDWIMRLEDALSRVQAIKVRYIDQLRGILKENPPKSGGLEAIVAVLDRSGRAIAAQKEREAELARAEGGVLDPPVTESRGGT